MQQKIAHLKILNNFQCTGGDCQDNCCMHSWRIPVPLETINKWKEIGDHEMKDALLESVRVDPKSKVTCFVKDSRGACPNLQGDGLCKIHENLGESFLPQVCREYPRLNHSSQNINISSLLLSCPEVVRLLIECKGGGVFSFTRGDVAHDVSESSIPYEISRILDSYLTKMFNGNFPVNISLIHIAQTLCDISQMSYSGTLAEGSLKHLNQGLGKKMRRLEKFIGRSEGKNDGVIFGQFWKLIFTSLPHFSDVYTGITGDFDNKLISALTGYEESDAYFEEIYKNTTLYRAKFNSDMPLSYPIIMRDYVRVKFNNSLLSTNPYKGNIISSFLYCAIPYAAIQLLSWLIFRSKGSLSNSDLVAVIYRVERHYDHSTSIYDYLDKNPSLLRLDQYYMCLESV